MKEKISLTGIKPTGDIHLGNYLGAIKPALDLAKKYNSFYFIADYHALNSIHKAEELREFTYQITATWIACGLDPNKVFFYKQSDIAEIFELTSFLTAFTAKGLMNRAHAYKDVISQNQQEGKDLDSNVNMGLYSYPILMSADILLFDANIIPVGKDQKQHVEIACDIAQKINHIYQTELFILPEVKIQEELGVIVGLDGRKMSKSYNNVIPLFSSQKQLRKAIMKIATNSQSVEEKKDPSKCNIFKLYQFFADKQEQEILSKKYLAGGMGWGEAKQILFEKIDLELADKRDKYNELMANKDLLDSYLEQGANKVSKISKEKMNYIKKICGLR